MENEKLIVTLSVGELRQMIREEITAATEALADRITQPAPSKWTNVAGAAKHFACSDQTIRNWIERGAPARIFGAAPHPMIRIDLQEFENWVNLAKRSSASRE